MPTKIEWSDETWNPVTGCAKVSQGCKHCYAEREWPRMTKLVPAYAGRDFTDVRTHADRLDQPLRWRRPRRIFVNSMSDLFHPDVPESFIQAVFSTMAQARQHTFQVLTKRPERMREILKRWEHDGLTLREGCGAVLPNVWLGVSVEDQAAADERIPLLLDTPAAVRWISAEPLLGPVLLSGLRGLITDDEDVSIDALNGTFTTSRYQEEPTPLGARVDWVVAGGESGPKARPMSIQWARSLRDQCAEAGVPFLFKQWGEWAPAMVRHSEAPGKFAFGDYEHEPDRFVRTERYPRNFISFGARSIVERIGKKAAGRLLDGVTHDGYPEVRHA